MKDKKEKKVLIIVLIILALLFIGIATNEKKQNIINNTEEATTEKQIKYITEYTWNEKDVKTFENTYYVDRGIENNPTTQKYVQLRVENKGGDLEEGRYKVESNGNFILYITEEEIDLNSYEGDFETVINDTIEITVEKGQYLYIVQGFNNQGTISLKK